MSNQPLTQERLKEVLDYDPGTGVFRWRATGSGRKAKVGSELNGRGYLQVRVAGKRYYAHRLAWLYVYGAWPREYIDHINRDTADNRIANLREATPAENQQNRDTNKNNTSGYLGVSWRKDCSRWAAKIMVDGKHHRLGLFKDLADAVAARKAAEPVHHPYKAP
jgi:hypothetical protein